jgi:BNR repeat-like domain
MKQRAITTARVLFLSSLLLFALALVANAAPAGQVRLGYASGDDWEPALAADQFGNVFVLWPHYMPPACAGCPAPTAMLQTSRDRGVTWSPPRVLVPDYLGSYQVDTQIVVDPLDGKTLYASWLQNNKSDTVVTRSTDSGQTWSAPVIADSTNAGTDKPVLVARGRDVYVGYDHQQKMWVSASHDGGRTFTSHLVRQNSEFGLSLAGGAAIDSHGYVYYAWAGYTRSGNARGPVNLYISKSTDGGSSWTHTLVDTSSSPPDCSAYSCGWAYLGAQDVIAADAGDTLYLLWNAGAADMGPERIYFARSADGGATWSSRQDVSTAAPGTEHAFPAITTGTGGDVRIAWMDTRNAPSWNVYYRSSTDGGASWSKESQLSSYVSGYKYLSSNGFAFPYGDYFSMDVDDHGGTQVVWGEGPNWTGPGNLWYAHVSR